MIWWFFNDMLWNDLKFSPQQKFEHWSLHCQSNFTCFGSKAHIVMLMNVTQHQLAAAVNIMFWADSDIVMVR